MFVPYTHYSSWNRKYSENYFAPSNRILFADTFALRISRIVRTSIRRNTVLVQLTLSENLQIVVAPYIVSLGALWKDILKGVRRNNNMGYTYRDNQNWIRRSLLSNISHTMSASRPLSCESTKEKPKKIVLQK